MPQLKQNKTDWLTVGIVVASVIFMATCVYGQVLDPLDRQAAQTIVATMKEAE